MAQTYAEQQPQQSQGPQSGIGSQVTPCFVFLASDDSSYMSGQILHPNGGEVING